MRTLPQGISADLSPEAQSFRFAYLRTANITILFAGQYLALVYSHDERTCLPELERVLIRPAEDRLPVPLPDGFLARWGQLNPSYPLVGAIALPFAKKPQKGELRRIIAETQRLDAIYPEVLRTLEAQESLLTDLRDWVTRLAERDVERFGALLRTHGSAWRRWPEHLKLSMLGVEDDAV